MVTKMTIAISLNLFHLIQQLLFTDGKETERNLHFKLKYALTRDLQILSKDASWYENKRLELVKKYGEQQKGSDTIMVTDANKETFRNEMLKLQKTEVTHDLTKIDADAVSYLPNDEIAVTSLEIALMQQYLINDPDFTQDLATNIPDPEEDTTETSQKQDESQKAQ